MKSQTITDNIQYLYNTYGNKITDDKKLLLLYWMIIDQVEMDKETINTKSFLEKATRPDVILDGKVFVECLRISS